MLHQPITVYFSCDVIDIVITLFWNIVYDFSGFIKLQASSMCKKQRSPSLISIYHESIIWGNRNDTWHSNDFNNNKSNLPFSKSVILSASHFVSVICLTQFFVLLLTVKSILPFYDWITEYLLNICVHSCVNLFKTR